jgi:PAS domain S-box-containing protein
MKPASQNNQNKDFFSQLSNPDTGVWELIFDSIPDMVALIDLDNIVVRANAAMRKNINIGEKNLTGNLCYNLMHHHGCASTNCPHRSMIIDRKAHTIEMFEPKLNLYLEISTIPLFDHDDKLLGSLHIARDITIQKESEERLRKYNAELNELNQSKDKFFSIVAHDLRSPFQGMLGFTDLILDELDTLTKEEIKDYLQKVRDSSYSTFSLLENLLNWSRLQTGRMQYTPSDFSLSETIEGIINLLDSNAQSKNISLINNLNTDYSVVADRQMVHSILLNLATNAIKFTYPGGSVIFDAKFRHMCQEKGDNKSSLNQKCLEISVSDTGTGMSADTIEKIFRIEDHFSLAGTDNEQGAGLGLILVKEMVEKHGGNLNISSQEGKGSVFAFTIPIAEALF